jgi:hypothetical protein
VVRVTEPETLRLRPSSIDVNEPSWMGEPSDIMLLLRWPDMGGAL